MNSPAHAREYATGVAFDGSAKAWFVRLASDCLERYLRVNGVTLGGSANLCSVWVARIFEGVERVGWPAPLSPATRCGPPEKSADDLEGRVKTVFPAEEAARLSPSDGERVRAGIQQLFKACTYPEFTLCRDSYRQAGTNGVCKRQQLTVAQTRLSGVACVDCPYTVSLSAEQHVRLVKAAWGPNNLNTFDDNPMCFLPEDFRQLRRFIWLHVRSR